MIRLIVVFGLAAGAILAAGRITAAQWHAIGLALLALSLRYGLVVLPWALAALLAVLWWKERRRCRLYEQMVIDEQELRRGHGARIWGLERELEKRPAQRRRSAR
jgi:hypothetical protein